MIRLYVKLSMWLEERFNKAMDEALSPPVVTYALPGAPPLGSRVLLVERDIEFVRENPLPGEPDEPWGMWRVLADPLADAWEDENVTFAGLIELRRVTWGELLSLGTVTLLEPTAEEKELEKLYGPTTARWGDPGKPCPFELPPPNDETPAQKCSLGLHHIGPHKDFDGQPLGLTGGTWRSLPRRASVSTEDLETLCTCGRPAAHEPDCPRYGRTAGGKK